MGQEFLSSYGTLADLISFEHKYMPALSPGTLSNKELAEITAYILMKNGFPAGNSPLVIGAGNTQALKP
jgi:mono/diheme cytochrome c family protein